MTAKSIDLVQQIEEALTEVTARADTLRTELAAVETEERGLQKALYALAPDRRPPRPEHHGKPGPKSTTRPPRVGPEAMGTILAALEAAPVPLTVKQISSMVQLSPSGTAYGLKVMREEGLVRLAGRDKTIGKPMLWAAMASANGASDA